MRNRYERVHTECNDVLEELSNCDIFNIYGPATGDELNDYELKPGEFEASNNHVPEEPLILTRDEVKRLGEQLIALSQRPVPDEYE